ncbi:hypothetical protein D3C78_1382340 [compost metagenome]
MATELDHTGVDLNHGDLLYALMAADFAQHGAVATADDQHFLRLAVGQQRYVGHHFVIDELIALGGLHHAVERHHAPQNRVFKNHQILMLGLLTIQHVLYREVLAEVGMQRFIPNFFLGHVRGLRNNSHEKLAQHHS